MINESFDNIIREINFAEDNAENFENSLKSLRYSIITYQTSFKNI